MYICSNNDTEESKGTCTVNTFQLWKVWGIEASCVCAQISNPVTCKLSLQKHQMENKHALIMARKPIIALCCCSDAKEKAVYRSTHS